MMRIIKSSTDIHLRSEIPATFQSSAVEAQVMSLVLLVSSAMVSSQRVLLEQYLHLLELNRFGPACSTDSHHSLRELLQW